MISNGYADSNRPRCWVSFKVADGLTCATDKLTVRDKKLTTLIVALRVALTEYLIEGTSNPTLYEGGICIRALLFAEHRPAQR